MAGRGHTEALSPDARRDAGRGPRAPGGAVVRRADAPTRSRPRCTDPEMPMLTLEDLGVLRDVREAGRRGGRDHHPDVLRLPGDGHDARRPRAPAHATPGTPPASRSRSARPGRATGSPSAAGGAARRTASPRPDRRRGRGGPIPLTLLPTAPGGRPARVRLGADRADLGVRRDRLQGALPLHGLPRAVRAREGDLMAIAAFHTLTVADVEELTDDAVAVTFEVPDDLADEFAFVPGQSLTLRRDGRRASSSAASTPSARRPAPGRGSASARSRTGCSRGGWSTTCAPATTIEVQTPSGRFCPDPALLEGGRHLCIAAGSGITPMLSVASHRAGERRRRDAALRQPHHRLGDVRRGARRPEEPLRPAAPARARAVAASRATSSCSRAGSTPTGCAGC